MRIVKIVLIVLLGVLIAIQFIRPERNLSSTVPETDMIVALDPPAEVGRILKTACYDCHSNNTKYPWYSNVAPVSFWLNDHVKDGKKHLNFSEWENYNNKRKAHKMEELVEEVKEGEMPLNSYTWVHGEARLTPEEISSLLSWAEGLRVNYELAVQRQ